MQNLVIEVEKEDGGIGTNIFHLKISEDSWKEFQKMILNGSPEDTNVFFNLEE